MNDHVLQTQPTVQSLFKMLLLQRTITETFSKNGLLITKTLQADPESLLKIVF